MHHHQRGLRQQMSVLVLVVTDLSAVSSIHTFGVIIIRLTRVVGGMASNQLESVNFVFVIKSETGD